MAEQGEAWKAQYEEAWNVIRDGLGELGDHVDDARAFLGDRALLDLLITHEPVEVIIATGVEIVACILGPDGERKVGAHGKGRDNPLSIAVSMAHKELVRREGDERWRLIFPADARETMLAQIHQFKSADRRS